MTPVPVVVSGPGKVLRLFEQNLSILNEISGCFLLPVENWRIPQAEDKSATSEPSVCIYPTCVTRSRSSNCSNMDTWIEPDVPSSVA